MIFDLVKTTKILMMMMEDNGIIIDDYEKMKMFIYHAFNDDRIKFFMRDTKVAGFVIWEAVQFGDGFDIIINKMVVLPEYRGMNIYRELQSIKDRYGKIYNVKWHRQKGKEFIPKVRNLQKELVYE